MIAASRIAGVGGHIPHPDHAVKILQTWVDSPFLHERTEYQAWMHSEISKSLLKMGEVESALRVSRQAVQLAERVDTSEPWHRRGDYARILLEIGRWDEALEECSAFLSRGEPSADTLPFLLTGAQALAANRPTGAANWLLQMDEIIVMHPEATHYYAPMEALRQRLKGASHLWHRAV